MKRVQSEKESERGTEHRKSIYSGRVQTTIGNIFFVLARLHLHTVQNQKRKAIKHKNYQLHFKGQLNHVQAGVLLGTSGACWVVTLTKLPLSSKMNVYPKNMKETAGGEKMSIVQTERNAPDALFSNTTFSTDVLQHEYIIYIYIFYTYIFQFRSVLRCQSEFRGCN